MSYVPSPHPWILGNLVFYAEDLQAASRAYELVISQKPDQAFGTVTLLTGEVVDWINLRYGSDSIKPSNAHFG